MQQLQVRADVDEVNAPLVAPRASAVASLKSRGDTQFPLSFVRIEPYVVPKKSLTGDNSERVDTRVLQIIYRFERPPFPVYAGQQVDVFIQRDQTAAPPGDTGPPSPTGGRAMSLRRNTETVVLGSLWVTASIQLPDL